MNTRSSRSTRWVSALTLKPCKIAASIAIVSFALGCHSSDSNAVATGGDPQPGAGGASGAALASGQRQEQGGLQYLTLDDPLLGRPEGKLAFFAGWRGTASVDRTDALSGHSASLAIKMTSPDGSETIQQFGRPLHTVAPGGASVAAADRNVRIMMFRSSADLIVNQILPVLRLGGEPSAPQPFAQDTVDKIRRGSTMSRPFADGSSVLIRNLPGGKEVFLWAITSGFNGGTPSESSMTYVQMATAPAGRARALAEEYRALPPFNMDPQWKQMEIDRTNRGTAIKNSSIADYNSSQADFNAESNASNAAARDRQQDRFNTSSNNTQRKEQAAIDNANLIKNQRAGLHTYFAWCSPTGAFYRQTDTLASPGVGFERCPARD